MQGHLAQQTALGTHWLCGRRSLPYSTQYPDDGVRSHPKFRPRGPRESLAAPLRGSGGGSMNCNEVGGQISLLRHATAQFVANFVPEMWHNRLLARCGPPFFGERVHEALDPAVNYRRVARKRGVVRAQNSCLTVVGLRLCLRNGGIKGAVWEKSVAVARTSPPVIADDWRSILCPGEDNLSKRFHYIVIAKRPGHGPQTQGSAATPATMVGSKIISNPMTVGSGSTPVSRLPTESLQTAPTNASFVTQAPHTSVYLGTRGSGSYGTPLNQPIGFASPYQQPSFGNPSYSATAFNGHPTSMAGYSTTTSARPVSYNQVPRFVSGSSGYYSEYSSRPLTRF